VDHGVDFVIIGGWSAILHGSVEAFDRVVWTLDLASLIESKRAAGREKDRRLLAELESLLDAEEPQ